MRILLSLELSWQSNYEGRARVETMEPTIRARKQVPTLHQLDLAPRHHALQSPPPGNRIRSCWPSEVVLVVCLCVCMCVAGRDLKWRIEEGEGKKIK